MSRNTTTKTTNIPNTEVDNNVVDLDFRVIDKQKFRINGDNSRMLELDIADLGIISRLKDFETAVPKILDEYSDKADYVPESEDEDVLLATELLRSADVKLREMLDDVFQSNVCELCAPSGTLFDPVAGKYRFEHIIDILIPLYSDNISKELKTISARSKHYLQKYKKK